MWLMERNLNLSCPIEYPPLHRFPSFPEEDDDDDDEYTTAKEDLEEEEDELEEEEEEEEVVVVEEEKLDAAISVGWQWHAFKLLGLSLVNGDLVKKWLGLKDAESLTPTKSIKK